MLTILTPFLDTLSRVKEYATPLSATRALLSLINANGTSLWSETPFVHHTFRSMWKIIRRYHSLNCQVISLPTQAQGCGVLYCQSKLKQNNLFMPQEINLLGTSLKIYIPLLVATFSQRKPELFFLCFHGSKLKAVKVFFTCSMWNGYSKWTDNSGKKQCSIYTLHEICMSPTTVKLAVSWWTQQKAPVYFRNLKEEGEITRQWIR